MTIGASLALLLVACGTGANNDAAVTDDRSATASQSGDVSRESLRTFITAISGGDANCAAVIQTWGPRLETFDQLRDYSDVSVVARLKTIRLTKPKERADHPLPGEFEADISVEAVLGGRFSNVSEGDLLTLALGTDATVEDWSQLEPQLRSLEERARFVMFLHAVAEPESGSSTQRFSPQTCNDPTGLLAEWPNGLLTDVKGTGFFAQDARARGEQLTGTTSPPTPDWAPTFPDIPPIGRTVEQAVAEFANTTGEPLVEAPEGWKELVEPRLAPIRE